MKQKLAILASGAGSNAKNIIEYFKHDPEVQIALIASNKSASGVLGIAEEAQIPTHVFTREEFFESRSFLETLESHKIDWIILAGFLWQLPESLVSAYLRRIINIHPALLPKYGGKGMYGHHVHEAVHAAGDRESGITIHYVDAHYDSGDIIFQAKAEIVESDNPFSIEQKVRALEIKYYPEIIEGVIKSNAPQ